MDSLEVLQLAMATLAAMGAGTSAVFTAKLWYKLGGYDEKHETHDRRLLNLERKVFNHG